MRGREGYFQPSLPEPDRVRPGSALDQIRSRDGIFKLPEIEADEDSTEEVTPIPKQFLENETSENLGPRLPASIRRRNKLVDKWTSGDY